MIYAGSAGADAVGRASVRAVLFIARVLPRLHRPGPRRTHARRSPGRWSRAPPFRRRAPTRVRPAALGRPRVAVAARRTPAPATALSTPRPAVFTTSPMSRSTKRRALRYGSARVGVLRCGLFVADGRRPCTVVGRWRDSTGDLAARPQSLRLPLRPGFVCGRSVPCGVLDARSPPVAAPRAGAQSGVRVRGLGGGWVLIARPMRPVFP